LFDAWHDKGLDIDIFAYCDDLTITLPNLDDIADIISSVSEHLARAGLKINIKKSAVLFPSVASFEHGLTDMTRREDGSYLLHDLPAVAPTIYFRVLGGNVTDAYGDFADRYNASKTDPFFDLLDRVHDKTSTHPQVIFSILQMCGSGKLVHLCCVTPPSESQRIADHFEARLRRLVLKLCGQLPDRHIEDNTIALIHDHAGLALPNYPANSATLFDNSRALTHTNNAQLARTRPQLVSNLLISPDVKAQLARHANAWMHFHHGTGVELTPTAFRICLCVRIRINPNRCSLPMSCKCGETIDAGMLSTGLSDREYNAKVAESEAIFVEHTLVCPKAAYGFTHRHNDIVDALCNTSLCYGIHSIKEPRFYDYDDGARNRPDITWRVHPKVTTDVTVRKPTAVLGAAAKAAANEKIKYHGEAVARLGHKFYPFAMETYGGFDKRAIQLIERLAQERPEWERYQFKRDMIHAASTALQGGVATTFIAADASTYGAGGFFNSTRR
jgi:hypothetical protein